MTFLAPMAALIAAVIAVPIMLVLYLLKLQRRPVRVASIMFWPVAKEEVQANVPLRMIRPSWLLLLHLLILGSLIAALGRPALHSAGVSSGRTVIIIDASASMSATDEPGGTTRLERAKARAIELIDQYRLAGGRTEVAVVGMAADAFALTNFTSSRTTLVDAVRAIRATDQPGNMSAALELADAMAAGAGEEGGEADPATVLLVSDGSFRTQGRLPTSSMRLRFERIGPASPTSGFEGAATTSPPDNLGIVGIAARRDARNPGVARIFVDVLNTNRAATAAPLTLSIDGVVVERRAIEVSGAAEPSPTPGRATTTFELTNPNGGIALVMIGREDSLSSDNAAGLVLPPAERPAILLVQNNGPRGGTQAVSAASWLLADALSEMRARSFAVVSGEEYERRATAGELGGVDMLVFDAIEPLVTPRQPSLLFGVAAPLEGLTARPVGKDDTARVLLWQRSHPVMRDVSMDAVVIARRMVVDGTDAGDSRFTELMRGPEGSLALLAEVRDTRHVIVGFALEQSNWPLQAGFAIFLANCVDYLTLRGESSMGVAFKSDQPVQIRVRPGRGGVMLRGPEEVAVREPDAPESEATVLSPGVLTQAGVYIIDGRSALDRAVVVNIADEIESGLQSPETVQVAGSVLAGVDAGPGQREIWPWCVMLAVALMAIEWVVYAKGVGA